MKTKEEFINYVKGSGETEFIATKLLDDEIERLEKGRFITPHNAFFHKVYKNGRIKLGEASEKYASQKSFLYALALGYIQRAGRWAAVDDCAEEIKGANIIYNLEEKIDAPSMRRTLSVPKFLQPKEPRISDEAIAKLSNYVNEKLVQNNAITLRLGGSIPDVVSETGLDWVTISIALGELKKQGKLFVYKDGPYRLVSLSN